MKVLGVVAGRRRECFGPAREPLPVGSKVVENVRFGDLGALPRTLATYAPFPARPPRLSWPGPGALK